MLRFLIRRLVVALLVAATVMTLAFIMTRLSGDLAISIAGPNATQADIEVIRKAEEGRAIWNHVKERALATQARLAARSK